MKLLEMMGDVCMSDPNQAPIPTISRDMINLYDRFTHGGMDRRSFMRHLAGLAGSSAAALALLPFLQNDYAHAETVKPDDPRLLMEEGVAVAEAEKGLTGYLARPIGEAIRSTVLVVHENRGLNPHVKDVTRRVALEGYIAFGLDVLSPDGGTPQDEDKARDMFAKLTAEVATVRASSAVRFLASYPQSNGKVAAIGFCWGGGIVNLVATVEPKLKAGISYYGPQPPVDRVAHIKAAMLLHYAALDQRINADTPAYKAALDAAQIRYEIYTYEGVDHAFNNDTNAARYNKDAADSAWSRSMAFLKRELG